MAADLHADDEVRFRFTITGTYASRRGTYFDPGSDALPTNERMAAIDKELYDSGMFSDGDVLSWADEAHLTVEPVDG